MNKLTHCGIPTREGKHLVKCFNQFFIHRRGEGRVVGMLGWWESVHDKKSLCVGVSASHVLSMSDTYMDCFWCLTWLPRLFVSNPPGSHLFPPLPCLMGQRPWATPEQTEFLKTHLPKLDEEKQNHGLKVFYSRVVAEFSKRWEPPLLPSDNDKQSFPAQLRKEAYDQRERVSPPFPISQNLC